MVFLVLLSNFKNSIKTLFPINDVPNCLETFASNWGKNIVEVGNVTSSYAK